MKKFFNGILFGIGTALGLVLILNLPAMINGAIDAKETLDSNVYLTAAEFDIELDPNDYDEWEQEWTVKVPAGVYPNNTNHEIVYHISK